MDNFSSQRLRGSEPRSVPGSAGWRLITQARRELGGWDWWHGGELHCFRCAQVSAPRSAEFGCLMIGGDVEM
jgi:hypothetical protein